MAKKRLSSGITDLGGGRYRIRVSGGYSPVTGDRVMFDKSIRGATDAQAEQIRAGFLLQIGETPTDADLTVAGFFDDVYLPWLDRRVAADKIRRETVAGYRAKYDNHIKASLGGVKLKRLTRYMLTSWLDDLALLPRFGATSQRHCYKLMHAALAQALEWEFIKTMPFKRGDDPGESKKKQTVYTAADANRLLDSLEGNPIEAAVITGMAAWLRRCEVAALTWSDYRFWTDTLEVNGETVRVDRCEVNIWRGLHQHKKEVWFEPTKTEGSEAIRPLPSWAAMRLKHLRGAGPIASQGGAQMKPNTLAYRFAAHLRKEELPHVPIMNLRHIGATLGLESGLSKTQAGLLLRHTSLRATERYLNIGSEFTAEMVESGGSWRSTQLDTEGRSTQLATQG